MIADNLILFGKHPAWPDHMFLAGKGGEFASCLKREFYDRSIVAASTAEVGSELLADCSYIYNRGSDFALVLGVPSRDSVGRSRFPLFAAVSLRVDAFEVINLESLAILQRVIREFLASLLNLNTTEALTDTDAVEAARASFQLPDLEHAAPDSKLADATDFKQLLRGLVAGERGFSLPGCSSAAALALAECACRQFKVRPSALLALSEKGDAPGFFIAGDDANGFRLSSFLLGLTPDLKIADWPEAPEVETVASGLDEFSSGIEPAFCPVIGILHTPDKSAARRDPRKLWVGLALLVGILLLVGVIVFVSISNSGAKESSIRSTPEAVEATRQLWTKVTSDYLEWVGPLSSFIHTIPDESNYFPELRQLAETSLNPFVLFDQNADQVELIKNPGSRIFRAENVQVLETVAANQQALAVAVKESFAVMHSQNTIQALRSMGLEPDILSGSALVNGREAPAISFSPALKGSFESAWRQHQARLEALEQMRRLETSILRPLRDVIPQLATFIVSVVSSELRARQGDVTAVFNSIRAQVEQDWLLNEDSFDGEALARSAEWPGLREGPATLQQLSKQLAYLRNYELMDAEYFRQEQENVMDVLRQVKAKLENARSKFPEEPFLGVAALSDFEEVSVMLARWPDLARHRKNYETVQSEAKVAIGRLSSMDGQIDSRLAQLTNPSLWLADKAPQLESITDVGLRQYLQSLLQVLQQKYADLAKVDRVGAYDAFDRDAIRMIEDFSSLDRALAEWALVEPGLGWPGWKGAISAEIIRQLEQSVNAADPAHNFDEVADLVVAKVENELREFVSKMEFAVATYTELNRGAVAPSELLQVFRGLHRQPLGRDQPASQAVSILEIASSAEAIKTLESVAVSLADLYWILQASMERGDVDAALLKVANAVARQFSNKDLQESRPLRSAWESALSQLASRFAPDSRQFSEIGSDVDALMPAEWVVGSFRFWQVVSKFRLELESAVPESMPSAEELQLRAGASNDPELSEFWQAAAEYLKSVAAAKGSQIDGLTAMVDASSLIVDGKISEDSRTIDLLLEDGRELRFLMLEEGTSPVFISANPLTISEFFELFRRVCSDAETLRDRFWPDLYPRSFESSGSPRGFTDIGVWRFGPKMNLPVFDVLSPEQQVMHQTLPSMAKEFADALKIRLPLPTEMTALLQVANAGSAILPMANFDEPALKETLRSSIVRSSVYSQALQTAGIEPGWSGGYAFETIPAGSARNRFYDVAGGAAELSYDGKTFFAQGASWLYAPGSSVQRVELSGETVYVDLGIRFAFSPPERSILDKLTDWTIGNLERITLSADAQ